MACVIGVDVGSQSVKAVVVDEDGRALATATRLRHEPSGRRLGRAGPAHWTAGAVEPVRAVRDRRGARRRRDARARLPGRRPRRARREAAPAAARDHLARPARGAPVRGARRGRGRGRADRAHRPEPRRLALRAEGDVAARRRTRALPRRTLARPGCRAHERLAHREVARTTPTPPRPCSTTSRPRASAKRWSRTPGSTRSAAGDPRRRRGDRDAAAARPPRRSGFRHAAR